MGRPFILLKDECMDASRGTVAGPAGASGICVRGSLLCFLGGPELTFYYY